LSLVDGLRFEEDAQLSNDEGALKFGNIGTVSRAFCIFGTVQTSEDEKSSVPDPYVFCLSDPDPSINKQKN